MKSYHFCFFRPGFAAMSFAAKRSGRALLLILVCLFAWPVCMTAAVAAAPPAQTKEDVQPEAGTGLGKHQLVRANDYIDWQSTRLTSSHQSAYRMPSSDRKKTTSPL